MVLNITSALALFVLIAISTVIFFVSKRIKVPYTVLLVAVGVLLVPIVNLPYLKSVFGFLGDMALTPELLFFIFLPVLIFESGFNMNMRRMLDSAWAISLLAVVGMVISTITVATLLFFALPLVGIEIPFMLALVFGAVISPTDPVAVLAIFKECHVPRRLGLVFEGESLLNDGTAVALFMVLLGVATTGFHGAETIMHGVFEFVMMLVLGVGLGLVMAAVFTRALRYTKKNEFVTVTLILISAHLVFITCELINHTGVIHVSSIIATTVAALFMGNYSRNTLHPEVDGYLGKLIEHMAFVVNSLVFLMAGLLFASAGVDLAHLWLPILVTVLVVAFSRVIAVYAVTVPLNLSKVEAPIPAAWEKLLAWGSLRGALSIIIVTLIPADFTVPGWNLPYTPQEFLLSLTIGCILATLFIKAPLIVPIMKKLKVTDENPLKKAHEADLGIYYLQTERARLVKHHEKGFVRPEHFDAMMQRLDQKLAEAEALRADLVRAHGRIIFDQSLHLAMVHVEKTALKNLFINEEVSEQTYRRLYSKLCLQQEKIEQARHDEIDPRAYTDRKDVFDKLVALVNMPFDRNRGLITPAQRLEYYRAQMIIARKAVQTIECMQTEHGNPVFLPESYDQVLALYRQYKKRSGEKADNMVAEYRDELLPYLHKLAERSLFASGGRALDYLHDKGLVDEHVMHDLREHFSV